MTKAKESDALKAYNARAVPEGFSRQRISRTKGPTLRFNGRLYCEYEADNKRDHARWQRIEVWETPGGAWVVHKAFNSDRAAEVDFHEATVIPAALPMEKRPTAVMDILEWSLPARSMAKEQGWRFEEFVE